MNIQSRKIQHVITTAMIIFSLLVSQNVAQVQRQECTNQLQPCMNYLNGNVRPPDTCCRPLEYVIKSKPECLCSLISIQGANQAEQAGVNVTEAQTLPGRCGQRINPLGCVTGTPDTRSTNSLPNSFGAKLRFSSLSTVVASIFVILQAL